MSSSRRVGRVRVLFHVSDPLPDDPGVGVPGWRLERERDAAGTTALRVLDEEGGCVGSLFVHAARHEDDFYGSLSRPDERYCYASALEVLPAARGHGLGRRIMLLGRHVAAGEGGRGLKHVISVDNEPSLRCNRAAGYRPVTELHGIRLGPRVLWYRRRAIAP